LVCSGQAGTIKAKFKKIAIKLKARGFAPIGMVECGNIGKMGLGILQYWVNG
jgi:hypothetical protein